jgi:perosamine synthetase
MIPIARPSIGSQEISQVLDVLASGALTSGAWVERFEREFADYVGVAHAVATSSGTAALEVALEAAGIGPGDEVIVPAFTFIATANAVVHRGARPVFVDIDPLTFAADPEQVEAALQRHPRVRAILAVHLFGLPAPVDRLGELARSRDVLLIEDAAQAHGAELGRKRAGSFGTLSAFSFYATKNLTTGEGGMVLSSDADLARRARLLVHVGVAGDPYDYEVVGYNHRMTNVAAAIGVAQLARLPEQNERRRRNAALLDELLAGAAGIVRPAVPRDGLHVYNQYTIRCEARDELARHLAARGIGSRVYYPLPVPLTRPYRELGFGGIGDWPVAQRACREVLSLPVHPGLSDEEVQRVGAAVLEFAASRTSGRAAV